MLGNKIRFGNHSPKIPYCTLAVNMSPLKGKSTFTLMDENHQRDRRSVFRRCDGKLALYQAVRMSISLKHKVDSCYTFVNVLWLFPFLSWSSLSLFYFFQFSSFSFTFSITVVLIFGGINCCMWAAAMPLHPPNVVPFVLVS